MAVIKGWKFPVDVDKSTGKIMTVEDNDNIRQDIKIILSTQKKERKKRSNFGTDTNKFMFRNIDIYLITEMTEEIKYSINSWEKHLKYLDVNTQADYENDSLVSVNISYVTDILPTVERFEEKIDRNLS